jgi:hypothetical protein
LKRLAEHIARQFPELAALDGAVSQGAEASLDTFPLRPQRMAERRRSDELNLYLPANEFGCSLQRGKHDVVCRVQ